MNGIYMSENCKFWIDRQKTQCGKPATQVFSIPGMQPQEVCEEHYQAWMHHFGLNTKKINNHMHSCEYIVDTDKRVACNAEASDQDFIMENNTKKYYCEKHLKKALSLLGYGRTSSLYDSGE